MTGQVRSTWQYDVEQVRPRVVRDPTGTVRFVLFDHFRVVAMQGTLRQKSVEQEPAYVAVAHVIAVQSDRTEPEKTLITCTGSMPMLVELPLHTVMALLCGDLDSLPGDEHGSGN